MSKHNQSAALGTLSDFASSLPTPEERLERIESRLESIEKLLNTVLYAVTDLNVTVDKVSKSPAKTTPTQKPKRQQAQKPTQKPTPHEQQVQVAKVAKQERAKKVAAVQEALEARIRACEQQVLDFLADGKTVSYKEILQEMRDHEFSEKTTKRVLNPLIESGKVKRTRQEIEGETVTSVSISG